jgi:CheY-like chemotaxis protein
MQKILLIGKSPAALEAMGSLLRQKGYNAKTTNNFNGIPARYKLEEFDLITMGGQVPPDTKASIMQAAKAQRGDILFVQGMAAIPGLVVAQIEGELHADQRDPDRPPAFHADTRTLSLTLTAAVSVTVTAWWQTTFVPPNPGSDSRVLSDETLPAGAHTISIPPDIPEQSSFVTVQVGNAVYPLRLEL